MFPRLRVFEHNDKGEPQSDRKSDQKGEPKGSNISIGVALGGGSKMDPILSTRKDGQDAKTGSQMEARSGSKVNKNGTQKWIATRTDKEQKSGQPPTLTGGGPGPWGGI